MDEDAKLLAYEVIRLRILLRIEQKKNEELKRIVANTENNYCELLAKYLRK